MKKTANRVEAYQESSVPLGDLEIGSMIANGLIGSKRIRPDDRRDRDQEISAQSHDPHHPVERGLDVDQVLEYIRRDDQIEPARIPSAGCHQGPPGLGAQSFYVSLDKRD